jgi:hypothetical protein
MDSDICDLSATGEKKSYTLPFALQTEQISVPGVLRVDEAGAIVTPVSCRLRSNSRRALHE